jgi:protein-tyrosine phosphatase
MKASARIFWIDGIAVGRLGIVPRPRGEEWLEDEIASITSSGVDVLVSLLERAEVAELGLREEKRLCESASIIFQSFPIRDRGVPESPREMLAFARSLLKLMHNGKNIAVHCRQSVGRSALLAATVLVVAGLATEKAFTAVEAARGCPVPDTDEQRLWVSRLEQILTTR